MGFFTYPQCNKYKLIIQKLYNRQANQKSNSAAWFYRVCTQLIRFGPITHSACAIRRFGDEANCKPRSSDSKRCC